MKVGNLVNPTLTLRFVGHYGSGSVFKLPIDVPQRHGGVGQHFTADVEGGELLPDNLDRRAVEFGGELDVQWRVGAGGHRHWKRKTMGRESKTG